MTIMMKVTVTMTMIMSRMMMMHAYMPCQWHGGKVSRFGVFWSPWHDDDARSTEAWGCWVGRQVLGLVLGGSVVRCCVVECWVGWLGGWSRK